MAKEKYVAYIGVYTHGVAEGIHIYDMDVKNGSLEKRGAIEVNNPSYMVKSHDNRFLYSICDEGIAAFEIQKDGNLNYLNVGSIKGMRGCYLSVIRDNRFIACAGYHDGKVTVLRLKENGEVGEIVSEVFHHGMGGVSDKNFRPHVSCVEFTPDENFLCAVDYGLDQVKIYSFDHDTGNISLVDIIRCEIDAAPRRICFSGNNRFLYVLCEASKSIYIFSYEHNEKTPKFEYIDRVSTVKNEHARGSAASGMVKSHNKKYLMCSNDGDNSVAIFKMNSANGSLEDILKLPVSGHYPKEIAFFPDDKNLLSLNHESGTITTLSIAYEEGSLFWHNKPLEIVQPNCVVIVQLKE